MRRNNLRILGVRRLPVKKKYTLCFCYECGDEFLVPTYKGKVYCPICGDDWDVKAIRTTWIDRFLSKRRRWTEDEDQTIVYGKKHNKTNKEIAKALELRTMGSVRKRATQLRAKGVL